LQTVEEKIGERSRDDYFALLHYELNNRLIRLLPRFRCFEQPNFQLSSLLPLFHWILNDLKMVEKDSGSKISKGLLLPFLFYLCYLTSPSDYDIWPLSSPRLQYLLESEGKVNLLEKDSFKSSYLTYQRCLEALAADLKSSASFQRILSKIHKMTQNGDFEYFIRTFSPLLLNINLEEGPREKVGWIYTKTRFNTC